MSAAAVTTLAAVGPHAAHAIEGLLEKSTRLRNYLVQVFSKLAVPWLANMSTRNFVWTNCSPRRT